MITAAALCLPERLAAELERKYFWWKPVGEEPRSHAHILAHAMNFASFAEVRRLESDLGAETLRQTMLASEPGWFNGRSWEFWRGRLALRTGQAIPEEPPRRSFDDDPV